ncbi:MAG: class I SAM-dependent methyltransferase [Halieaceae bacterium]|jgi:predicted methyltransferase|nr:class I SAM-dependent methyltransferase [Halieaceae bacterium]
MQTKTYPRFSAQSQATSLKLILMSVVGVVLSISGGSVDASIGNDSSNKSTINERDQYSKPQEVFVFSGVGQGSVVVDVGAGSGYNTSRLLPLIGNSGKVYSVGGNDKLEERIEKGDMMGTNNVVIAENAAAVPDGVADVVLLIREFHLAPDHVAYLKNVHRMLKAGGRVAVVEVRTGKPIGYDHTSHRSGEQTIIKEFEEGGFEFVGKSDMLRREKDDYTAYAPAGKRYITDRMLLLFRKI